MENYHTTSSHSTFILVYLNVSYAVVSVSCNITFSLYYLSETNKGDIMPLTCPAINKVQVKVQKNACIELQLNTVSMLS